MLDGPRWTRSNSCTPPAVKKLEHARRENKAKEVQERTAAERAEMQKRVDEAVAEIKDLEARRRELEKEQHELLVKRKEYVESLRKYRSEQFAQVHQGEDARAVIAARIDQRMQLARDGLLEHRHIYELVYNIAADDERRETRRKANKWDEPKGLVFRRSLPTKQQCLVLLTKLKDDDHVDEAQFERLNSMLAADLQKETRSLVCALCINGTCTFPKKELDNRISTIDSLLRIGPPLQTMRVWRDWLRLRAQAGWEVLDVQTALERFPRLSKDLCAYLFATPTIAKCSSPYSTTVKRAHNFVGGETQYLNRKSIRVLKGKSSTLVYGCCRPSMAKGHNYKVFVRLPSLGTCTWQEYKQNMGAFCTCKNGNSGGNCAHVAALMLSVGQFQGVVEVKSSLCDKAMRGITGARRREQRRAEEFNSKLAGAK
eukprot:TRINITY_DN768_c0_g2_i4.p1 TRINITY_DN768_c0_g2~~TRINITY_DN768_c0_g2_i4.p1  ORF type:complete len:428 (-),score=66.34 TRINITY_DN768_c0_g2_i4:79-1362(-)